MWPIKPGELWLRGPRQPQHEVQGQRKRSEGQHPNHNAPTNGVGQAGAPLGGSRRKRRG
ncbi:MAG: hypothetical protein M5R40_17530 [Anaerolineae bacterium]|nr:hypothetical protein [Anaerolineae bacterium]